MAEHPAARGNVNLRDLRILRQAGLLSLPQFVQALDLLRDQGFWQQWAERSLLALAAAHLLAGILFFFAFNWADLPTFAKFAIIQSAIILCIGAGLRIGLDSAGGKALLIGAAVLVLVLMAAIGMVYQTGADAWELFAAWTVLILIWTLAGRSVVLWLIWLLSLCLTLGLYADQVLTLSGWIGEEGDVFALPAMAVAAGLGVFERGRRTGIVWLAVDWVRSLLVVALLALLMFIALDYLFDSSRDIPDLDEWAGSLPLLLVIGGFVYLYRHVVPDFRPLAAAIGALALWLVLLGFRLAVEQSDSVLAWFIMAGWSIAVLYGATRTLTYFHRRFPGAPS